MIGTLIVLGAVLASGKEDGAGAAGGAGDGAPGDSADPTNWRRFDGSFKKFAAQWGVDWMWLKAIAMNESSLGTHPSVARGLREPSNVEASKSDDGLSWGLMQVTLRTARDMDPQATAPKLNDADYSINLAARYLAKLKGYFAATDPRFTEWVIKGYNQGPGNSLKERRGEIGGYAQEYWERFQRNLARVKAKV